MLLLLVFFSLNFVVYFHKYSYNYIYCAKQISSLAAGIQRGSFTFAHVNIQTIQSTEGIEKHHLS